MKKNKETIGWISAICEVAIGLGFVLYAQSEISSSAWRYTWTPPYSSYEASVLLGKWVGIILLLSGVINIGLKLYREKYTNEHVEDINQLTQKGEITKCPDCGLMILADVDACPRCGKIIAKDNLNNVNKFCKKCGNQISMGELFCSKCGNEIDY